MDIYLFQKELDGYKFPVYSTELCPRNQTEWNERSSAINCTKDNGYLCFPNEKFTQLLEFCYRTRFIWIQEGTHYFQLNDKTARLLLVAGHVMSSCSLLWS